MGIILLVVALLGIGFFIGYRIGSRFVRQENSTLHRQVNLLQQYSTHWAQEATGKYTLVGQVSDISRGNLSATIGQVIQLLSAYQMQNAGNSNQQQNEKVSELITKAKSIGTLHD